MNDRTVLLCYDSKEEALAKELKSCIEGIFKNGIHKMVSVEVCANPSSSKKSDQDVWQNSLNGFFDSNQKSLIFVLCSPYSIRQPWVNFISGAVTLKIEQKIEKNKKNTIPPEQNLPGLIPICHSGQKSKDLPHYLLSRQALDIQHESFFDALALKIGKTIFAQATDNDHLEKLNAFCKNDVRERMCNLSEEALEKGLQACIEGVFKDRNNSGQTSKDLLHLLPGQAMDIQHESFLDELTKKIGKTFFVQATDNDHLEKLNAFCKNDVRERMCNIAYGDDADFDDRNSHLEKHRNCILKKTDKVIEINSTENFSLSSDEGKLKKLEEMYALIKTKDHKPIEVGILHRITSFLSRFLIKSKDHKPMEAVVAIGVQNCLYHSESKSFFVGLRRDFKWDDNFKSYCSSDGVFDVAYQIQEQGFPTSLEDLENPLTKDFSLETKDVKNDLEIYNKIKERLEAMGHMLWDIKFQKGEPAAATIFVNQSGPVPRFEIGVWRFIELSDLTAGNSMNKKAYWIWVKDGEIFYWTFPDEKSIPRFISGTKASNPGLITKEEMCKYYGRPEKYTPFAADDVLGVDNVVKERFSAAARSLLSCF